MMQYVEALIFLAVWIALVAAVVAGIERVLERYGFRASPVTGHDARDLPIEGEE